MFKVIIALKAVGSSKSLAEACQIFIKKIQDMIQSGGVSEYVIYEACSIDTAIDGVDYMMNFDAIGRFAYAAGIINENGSLINKPAPYIPREYEREILIAAHNNSMEAYIAENVEMFARACAAELGQEAPESEAEPAIIILKNREEIC
jgi:hypothetical protein